MNIPMQQAGPMGMNQMVQGNAVQLQNPQHAMHPTQTPIQQSQEKVDNISKVKSLIGPLRDSLSVALKTAAQTLHQNSLVDTSKGIDPPDHRFNKNMEEFYSVCDQIELHLRTSIECLAQNSSSVRYMPVSVIPIRTENIGVQEALNYPQYLMTVRTQVQYIRDIYNTLYNAARAISSND
jgi:mediator of RNA polymerase II transcription subunit 29